MSVGMLDSQIATLEPRTADEDDAIRVSLYAETERIITQLHLAGATAPDAT
jgi:gluconate kinase